MSFTLTLGRKPKSRYFIISYGTKKNPEIQKPDPNSTHRPLVKTVPIAENVNGENGEMIFANLSLKVDPDMKAGEKTPHVSRNKLAELIMKHHPGYNYIVIMNIIELKKKDFEQWNG